MVLVHPALAGYDPDLGFVPDRGTGYRARLASAREVVQRGGYAYRLESYAEHARLVYQAFQRHAWPELAPAAARLERACGWPDGVMERAAHLLVLLHDVGKLNRGWQNWVLRYQEAIGQPAPPGFYAHTDADPTNPLHQEKQKSLRRKPPRGQWRWPRCWRRRARTASRCSTRPLRPSPGTTALLQNKENSIH